MRYVKDVLQKGMRCKVTATMMFLFLLFKGSYPGTASGVFQAKENCNFRL